MFTCTRCGTTYHRFMLVACTALPISRGFGQPCDLARVE